MLNTKGLRFPIDVVLVCIRWYVAYPLSYRHLEEMMAERGISVDHSSINRWAVRFLAQIERNPASPRSQLAAAGEWTRQHQGQGRLEIPLPRRRHVSWTPKIKGNGTGCCGFMHRAAGAPAQIAHPAGHLQSGR
jgi:hypothetical protein